MFLSRGARNEMRDVRFAVRGAMCGARRAVFCCLLLVAWCRLRVGRCAGCTLICCLLLIAYRLLRVACCVLRHLGQLSCIARVHRTGVRVAVHRVRRPDGKRPARRMLRRVLTYGQVGVLALSGLHMPLCE